METNPVILTFGLCGLILIVSGWIMQKYPPKKINDFYGYRTSRSKRSQEHWVFAQKESAKLIIQVGYYNLLCCVPFFIIEFQQSHIWIAIGIVSLLPFIAIIQTEKALKDKFGK